jgi:hypothetical protein
MKLQDENEQFKMRSPFPLGPAVSNTVSTALLTAVSILLQFPFLSTSQEKVLTLSF